MVRRIIYCVFSRTRLITNFYLNRISKSPGIFPCIADSIPDLPKNLSLIFTGYNEFNVVWSSDIDEDFHFWITTADASDLILHNRSRSGVSLCIEGCDHSLEPWTQYIVHVGQQDGLRTVSLAFWTPPRPPSEPKLNAFASEGGLRLFWSKPPGSIDQLLIYRYEQILISLLLQ